MDKFYYPDGALLESSKDFVKFYSEAYYFVNRSNRYEDKIVSALTKDTELTNEDLTNILLWKSGGKEDKKGYIKRPRTSEDKNIKIKAVSGAINEYKQEYDIKEFTDETALKFIEMMKEDVDGIGAVYAITLLYFLSHGEYPIYDRFADMAIYAICNNIDPSKTSIKYKKPDLNAKTFYETIYLPRYFHNIKRLFEKDYKNRNIDRALWTYGHLFRDTKEKREKVKMEWVDAL